MILPLTPSELVTLRIMRRIVPKPIARLPTAISMMTLPRKSAISGWWLGTLFDAVDRRHAGATDLRRVHVGRRMQRVDGNTGAGEIAMVNMPGQAQEKFAFSVRNDSVAHDITRLMGGRVTIHYEQHPGIPLRCLGDTEYFITGVKPTP